MSAPFGPSKNVTDHVVVGENVQVKPMTVIGFSGFGFAKKKNGKFKYPLKRNPHTFKIIIGDNVEIGASCCIDRGSWRDSIIGSGTKIDNMVHTGHNTQIGKDCIICVGVTIGGSSTIGDRTFIGMNAIINPHINIGKNCTIGSGAVVTKDVPDGWTVVGNPARRLVSVK